MKRNVRVANNLDVSGTLNVTGSVILGDNTSDIIFISGTLKNNGNASLTGSFSGSGANLNELTASNISNFSSSVRDVFLAGTNITINQVGSKYAISSSATGPGGTIYVGGNITGSGTDVDPLGTTLNPTFITVTASNYTGSSIKIDYIDFSSSNPSFNPGRLHYDTAAEILKFDLPYENTELNIGKQLIAKVKNNTGTTIAKGKVVYVNGAQGASEILYVTTASWESDPTSAYTFGFTMSELASQDIGYVLLEGILEGIDTSGYSAGSLLYLSSSGDFTVTKPVQPKHQVRLGYVAREQDNNGSIFVRIQNGYEVDELHDVLITNSASYDLFMLDSDGLWKNTKTLAGNYTFSGNNQFTGTLDGTSSYANNADTLDGIESVSFALKTDVTGAIAEFPTRTEITGTLNPYALSENVSSSFVTYAVATSSLARLDANNNFTGINTLGAFTGSSAFISGDVRINGTASVGVLETVNQTSLNVGDKYIILLSGAVDHASLDGSGLLWGSGAVGDPTQGPLGEMAYIRYYDTNPSGRDQLEIFPGLKVSGSLTASAASSFTQITASGVSASSFFGDGSGLINLPGIDTSNFALKNATNTFTAFQNISGGLNLTGSLNISGSNKSNISSQANTMDIACDNFNLEILNIAKFANFPTIIIGDNSAPATLTLNANTTTRNLVVNNESTFTGISTFNARVVLPFITKSVNYTLDEQLDYIVTFSGSNLTATLPQAQVEGSAYIIKNMHTSSLFITSSLSKIDNATSGIFIKSRYTSYTFVSNGTDWLIV